MSALLDKDRSEKKETNKISRIFGVKKLLIKSTSISVKFLYILETSFAYNSKNKFTQIKALFIKNFFSSKIMKILFVSFFPNGPYYSMKNGMPRTRLACSTQKRFS